MYMFCYICIYVYMYTCIHVYMYMHRYMHRYMYICIYIYIYIYRSDYMRILEHCWQSRCLEAPCVEKQRCMVQRR